MEVDTFLIFAIIVLRRFKRGDFVSERGGGGGKKRIFYYKVGHWLPDQPFIKKK
jgi:hypothetical protein